MKDKDLSENGIENKECSLALEKQTKRNKGKSRETRKKQDIKRVMKNG